MLSLRNRVADLIDRDEDRHPEGRCPDCDRWRTETRAKADAIIAMVIAEGWQVGMDSAPKDGTRILAYGRHTDLIAADAEQGVKPGFHWWGLVVWDVWREPHQWVFNKDGNRTWSEPTHWRVDVLTPPAGMDD